MEDMFMAAIPIERDVVVWARLPVRICPVTTWSFERWSVPLIAVVSYCIHCKACMHLNHGICTSSTDYLYCLLAYDMLHNFSLSVSLSYTIRLILQDHHVRPCYTVTSIINAQISLVPRLPISFLLALPEVKRRLPLNLCIYTLPIPSLANQLHEQYNL